LVFDGAVPPCAAMPLGAPELGVLELPGDPVTRVSVFAAVPPCGFTDWDAVGPAGLSPALLPALAGAFTFWFALVFWLVLAFVFTFVLVFVGVNVLLYVGPLCGTGAQPAAAQTATAIKVRRFLFMAVLRVRNHSRQKCR
jgi:hypothetical protein